MYRELRGSSSRYLQGVLERKVREEAAHAIHGVRKVKNVAANVSKIFKRKGLLAQKDMIWSNPISHQICR